jgi:hypothetical protein
MLGRPILAHRNRANHRGWGNRPNMAGWAITGFLAYLLGSHSIQVSLLPPELWISSAICQLWGCQVSDRKHTWPSITGFIPSSVQVKRGLENRKWGDNWELFASRKRRLVGWSWHKSSWKNKGCGMVVAFVKRTSWEPVIISVSFLDRIIFSNGPSKVGR